MRPRAAHFGKGAAPPRGAAAPASNHLGAKLRQAYKLSETSRTLPASAPQASSRDDDRLQASKFQKRCRSWHQLVEQLRDTQLRRPFVNIAEINHPGEELANISSLQLRVGFQRPDQFR